MNTFIVYASIRARARPTRYKNAPRAFDVQADERGPIMHTVQAGDARARCAGLESRALFLRLNSSTRTISTNKNAQGGAMTAR